MKIKRFTALLLTLALAALLASPALAVTQLSSASVNRYNVMLVIDGSGSLTQTSAPTDPTGLRYDSLKLFLGLLTNSGNNVGAIVFNQDLMLNSGLQALTGQTQKLALAQQIEDAGVGGDTDIGGALLTAVQTLQGKTAENGLPSAIVLLSDGNTDLPSATDAEKAQSADDEEKAIQLAAGDNIPVYGIWLNANNSGSADEMQNITSRTGGDYEEVKAASDLTAAFERFYTLINNTSELPVGPDTFDASGSADLTFTVPSFGVEEVNIIMKSEQVSAIRVTQPDATEMSSGDLAANTISTREYQMLKLVSPQAGTWTLHIEGTPGAPIDISMLCNSTLSAALSIPNLQDAYKIGATQEFDCTVTDSAKGALTNDDYQKLTATLCLIDSKTQQQTETPMVFDGSGFTADATFGAEGAFYAYAVVSAEGLSVTTEKVLVTVGNLPPQTSVTSIYETVKTGLFHSGKWSRSLSGLFSDPEGEALSYTLLHVDSPDGVVTMQNDTLSVNCNGQGRVKFTIAAQDPKGATSSIEVMLIEKNVTVPTIAAIAAAAVLAAVIALAVRARKRHRYCELTLSISGFDTESGYYSPMHTEAGFVYRLYVGDCSLGACGMEGRDYWFEAVPGKKDECVFTGKKPFYIDGVCITRPYAIHSGVNMDISAVPPEQGSRGISISAG